eukprot:symbB.v1.2.021833.t1/scaffold1911.1/size96319/2
MKLQVRPLKGETFDLEVEPAWTVEAVKAAVATVKPELAAELQKVLFKGKVLQDADTLQDHGIIDGDFVVIMMAKTKEAPPPAAPAPPVAPAAAASAPPADAAAQAAQAAENELAINSLCDMGFPRELVRQCLRAAFNNPDRAVEYLTSGIPAHLQHLATGEAPPPPATPAPTPAPVIPAPPPQPPMIPPQVQQDTGPLAQLANHPRFNQLRAAVQQHPSTLNQVLTLIAKGDPNMIAEIAEHQEEFVRLLSLPPAPNDPITAMLQAAQAGGVAPGAPGQQAPAPPPQLGAAGEEAIQRLQQLGFARNLCVEAYLACERNEEMAANFLFDRMEE